MLTRVLPKTPLDPFADLFARGLSQRVIDPILPAGPAFLKVLDDCTLAEVVGNKPALEILLAS